MVAVLLVAACVRGPSSDDNPYAPGVSRVSEAVDGLIVGHRLMAAGEYELALKAYYRAGLEHGLNADVLSAIGSANLRLGRLGQAESQLRQAIDMDERFVPAWNNLGVALMERGKIAEARNVFQTAYALDNGASDHIRDNLALAIANLDDPGYDPPTNENTFQLMRRGNGQYLLLSTPL